MNLYLISSSKTEQIKSAKTPEQRLEAKRLNIFERIVNKILKITYLENKQKVLELVDEIIHENNNTDFISVASKLTAFNELGKLLGKSSEHLLTITFYENSTSCIDNEFINDNDKSEIVLNISGIEFSVYCDKSDFLKHKSDVKNFLHTLTKNELNSSYASSISHSIVSNIETAMLETIHEFYATVQNSNLENKTNNHVNPPLQSGRQFIEHASSLYEMIDKFSQKTYLEKKNSTSDIVIFNEKIKTLLIEATHINTPEPFNTICVFQELTYIKEKLQNIVASLDINIKNEVHSIQDYREVSNIKSKLFNLSKEIDLHLKHILQRTEKQQVYTFDNLDNNQQKFISELEKLSIRIQSGKKSQNDAFSDEFIADSQRSNFTFKNGEYIKAFKQDKSILDALKQEVIQQLDFSSENLDKSEALYYISSFLTQSVMGIALEEIFDDIGAMFGDSPKTWGITSLEGTDDDSDITVTKNKNGSVTFHWNHKKPDIQMYHSSASDPGSFYSPSTMGLKCDFYVDFEFTITPERNISVQEMTTKLNMVPAKVSTDV